MKFSRPEEIGISKAQNPPKFGRTKNRLTKAEAALAVAMITNPTGTHKEWASVSGVKPRSIMLMKSSIDKKTEGDIGNALLTQSFGIDELAESIRDCLKAENHVYIRTKNDKGKEVLELRLVPNWAVRIKAAEMVAKLGNQFPATKFAVRKEVEVIHTRKEQPIDHSVSKAKENVESIESGAIPASYEVIPDASTIN